MGLWTSGLQCKVVRVLTSVSERTCSRNTNLPPGLSTRRISLRPRSTSGTEHSVSVQTTASAEASASGSASTTPWIMRGGGSPFSFALCIARSAMKSLGSTPTRSSSGPPSSPPSPPRPPLLQAGCIL